MAPFPTRARGVLCFVLPLICGIGLGGGPVGGVARADGVRRVAATPPRVTGTGMTSLQDGFRSSLAGGLAAAGLDVTPALELDAALASHPALAACNTDVCLAQLGELLGVRAMLRSAVEVIGSSNYSFRLELYDVRAHRVAAALDDACTICTVREANEALSRAAASLGHKLGALDAAATSAPPPAKSPATSPTASAATSLPKEPATRPREAEAHVPTYATPRSRLFLGVGAGALVLGLGAVAGGAALIAIDGRATGDAVGGNGQPLMQAVQQTRTAGIVVTTAGGVILAGAGVLFWRSHANRRR